MREINSVNQGIGILIHSRLAPVRCLNYFVPSLRRRLHTCEVNSHRCEISNQRENGWCLHKKLTALSNSEQGNYHDLPFLN